MLDGTGYSDAGSYSFEPKSTFLEGNKDNYEITFINNSLRIIPVSLTITASGSKEYDGKPLNGSEVVEIEGLAERDSISVTASGTITDAGTAENPYTVDWGDTNPDNYIVTQEPGTLEVKPKEVTIRTGSYEKVYDGSTLYYDSYELSPSDPWVDDQAPIITVTGSITNAGNTPNIYKIEWNGVNENNYKVTEELGTLTVNPVEVVLTADCSYAVSGDIEVASFGIKVQVNNVDSSQYQVYSLEDNLWQIDWSWGDKTEVSTFLIKDDTSFAITTLFYLTVGDYSNYSIEKVDQEGELDISPSFGLADETGEPSLGKAPKALSRTNESADTSADEEAPAKPAQDEESINSEGPETEEAAADDPETEAGETEETETDEAETDKTETDKTETDKTETEDTGTETADIEDTVTEETTDESSQEADSQEEDRQNEEEPDALPAEEAVPESIDESEKP